MHPVSAILIFIMIWWTVIFCVLPIGLSTTREEPDKEGEYLAPGAPKNLNMKKKLIITTLVSIVLWIIVYCVIQSGIFDPRDLINQTE